MSYKTKDLEKLALKAIESENLVFIEEVVSFLPCERKTFYNKNLHELHTIKEALEKNKVNQKIKLRNKWALSDNPTAQIAYYRLLSTEEENDKLNGGKQRQEVTGLINVNHTAERDFKEAAKKYRESIANK